MHVLRKFCMMMYEILTAVASAASMQADPCMKCNAII